MRFCPCNGRCHGQDSPCSFDCFAHHEEIPRFAVLVAVLQRGVDDGWLPSVQSERV